MTQTSASDNKASLLPKSRIQYTLCLALIRGTIDLITNNERPRMALSNSKRTRALYSYIRRASLPLEYSSPVHHNHSGNTPQHQPHNPSPPYSYHQPQKAHESSQTEPLQPSQSQTQQAQNPTMPSKETKCRVEKAQRDQRNRKAAAKEQSLSNPKESKAKGSKKKGGAEKKGKESGKPGTYKSSLL